MRFFFLPAAFIVVPRSPWSLPWIDSFRRRYLVQEIRDDSVVLLGQVLGAGVNRLAHTASTTSTG